MATVLEAPPAPEQSLPAPAGFRGRALERGFLLWNLPLVLLAAWGLAVGQRHPAEAFLPILTALGTVWIACFLLHLLLCATRFDGDLLLLPLFSLLLLIGTAYHLDLKGPGTPGFVDRTYLKGALIALGILAVVTAGGRYFRKASILLEEKVWWRIAGDRPYYESVPFQVLLLGTMALLLLLLKLRGIRADNGALIQVPLPGGFRFTPSEVIRLAVAFFLADYLGRNSRVLRNLRQPAGRSWPLNRIHLERRAELAVVLGTVGLYCLFFYVFRDFGPAAVIIFITLTTLYAATGRILTPLLLALGITLAVAIPTWQDVAFHTLRNRGEMWLNPWDTHFPNGDHQARILWSIATGGWFGMGAGTENLPRTLPLARNDAAFAGIAATMGMWVALALLGVYAAMTWRGMLAARQAPTDRMRLLGFALTSLLAVQAVWICGAMVRVFPFTGINLPFISSGLTSMVVSSLALGTLWNLSRAQQSVRPDATEGTPEVARTVARLAVPMTAGFALPAVGVLLYGCPWLLGDRTLTRTALGVGRKRERVAFNNPYIERYRRRFPRGRVFSADGKLLAVSNPNREEIEAIRELAPSLATEAERDRDRGVEGERYYPLGSSAAHLIGWTTQGQFAAKEGSVETSWDPLLRGYRPQDLPYFFRNRNNPLVRPPVPQDLQLTIRSDVQEFAARKLADAVKTWRGAGGAVVVYDVSDGAVLAAATAPSFDPNGLTLERMQEYVAQNSRTQVLTNKALAKDARYFPGSSFKILTAAASLDEGIQGGAVPSGGITCRNGRNAEPITWELDGKRWRRDAGKISDYGRGGHGSMQLSSDTRRAMIVSCNVFFAKLAAELGPERFHRALERAELSSVPSVSEVAEHLPYSGFGQIDIKASPLELAMLASIAAFPDGDPAPSRPHWVQAVVTRSRRREPEGIFGAPDRKPYQPFSAHAARELRPMLTGVVEDPSGTAHAAFFRGGAPRLPGITVGGKTGTAEFEKTVTSRGRKRQVIGRHAWFAGFARSDHEIEPRTLAFAVLVEDVRAGGTGGKVCAPVAREVIDKILPVLGEVPQGPLDNLERFYRRELRPRLGPLGPIVDWLRQRMQPNR